VSTVTWHDDFTVHKVHVGFIPVLPRVKETRRDAGLTRNGTAARRRVALTAVGHVTVCALQGVSGIRAVWGDPVIGRHRETAVGSVMMIRNVPSVTSGRAARLGRRFAP
jgi:hypothetical protein